VQTWPEAQLLFDWQPVLQIPSSAQYFPVPQEVPEQAAAHDPLLQTWPSAQLALDWQPILQVPSVPQYLPAPQEVAVHLATQVLPLHIWPVAQFLSAKQPTHVPVIPRLMRQYFPELQSLSLVQVVPVNVLQDPLMQDSPAQHEVESHAVPSLQTTVVLHI
jgi:hypothetical protein